MTNLDTAYNTLSSAIGGSLLAVVTMITKLNVVDIPMILLMALLGGIIGSFGRNYGTWIWKRVEKRIDKKKDANKENEEEE